MAVVAQVIVFDKTLSLRATSGWSAQFFLQTNDLHSRRQCRWMDIAMELRNFASSKVHPSCERSGGKESLLACAAQVRAPWLTCCWSPANGLFWLEGERRDGELAADCGAIRSGWRVAQVVTTMVLSKRLSLEREFR